MFYYSLFPEMCLAYIVIDRDSFLTVFELGNVLLLVNTRKPYMGSAITFDLE